jgi:hypothetical protein
MTSPPNSVPPKSARPKKHRGPAKRILIWVGSIFGAFLLLGIVLDATGVSQPGNSRPVAQAQSNLTAASPTPHDAPNSVHASRTPISAPASHARTAVTHALTPTSTKAPAVHHVIYEFGLNGTLRGDDLEQIGLGWNDPNTGVHELPPETSASSTTPLHFPYIVQFDVTNLKQDNQHISAGTEVDTPDVTVDCTIIIDGQVVDAEAGTTATMNPDGTVNTGGSADCMIDR